MTQTIIAFNEGYRQIESILEQRSAKRFLLVCGSSFKNLRISIYINNIKTPHTVFSNFTPNPKLEQIEEGVSVFLQSSCDSIVSVGGGSAIDVAKCIRLYSKTDNIPLIAIPTTAGTGSESTTFAVVYKNGVKHSIGCALPDYAILEETVIEKLPLLQKKSTMFDALCQGIESIWSKLSTDESRELAKKAIRLILANHEKYLSHDNPDKEVFQNMLLAASFSGQAINISKTTAAHAMSYGITSMFGLPHGYAVALCLASVWKFMEHSPLYVDNISELIDISSFENLMKMYSIVPPCGCSNDQLIKLSEGVNEERLNNNPVYLDSHAIIDVYKAAFSLK